MCVCSDMHSSNYKNTKSFGCWIWDSGLYNKPANNNNIMYRCGIVGYISVYFPPSCVSGSNMSLSSKKLKQ